MYESVWRSQARVAGHRQSAPTWCVFLTESGFAWEQELVTELEARGATVLRLRAARASDREQLPSEPLNAIYLCAGEAEPLQTATGLLKLTKAMLRRSHPGQICIVTRSANHPSVSSWSLTGFTRVLAQEHPELGGIRIDVDAETSASEVASELVAAVCGCETEIALRQGGRFVRRLVPMTPPPCGTFRVRPEAAYVIAGSSGGLGRETAMWLAKKGARHLVLLQRSEPDAAFLDCLRGAGATCGTRKSMRARILDNTDY